MKARIFENLSELNLYLESRKSKQIVAIEYSSMLVKEKRDANGEPSWEVVDRFLVVENE